MRVADRHEVKLDVRKLIGQRETHKKNKNRRAKAAEIVIVNELPR
jgi:hypothetical protein